ncbi:GMC family oxidoreductase N-terminal domain-containing protein [Cupriavidus sp. P-10]|uniref:GMC family oxidoreductase n=1 Tax=Cupriavidus sp. P-10 TaxID=2027911 RepID=UPI000E2F6F42|nr:GMC family oxidoreductase N-terminal domain-containing protein [Cupriavidus sp. P-10]BDB27273.1 GMC family oxidoreductase N-terminal domain-containing protein [Cupriavidus sp. P-10]
MTAPSASADEFDYVIVGAGAAGCVLANRLSADKSVSVCLLEAGPPDRNPFIHIPAGFIKLAYDSRYTWQFKTEPAQGTAGRRIPTTQGKTLGGSSAINGFNCTRGQAQDYDEWASLGNRGWGYTDVLSYFKRSERRIGNFDPRYRGSDGPLPITDCDWRHPLCDAFIESAHSVGVPRNPDYNGETQEGAGYYQRWIYRGRRYSAAYAFLRPVLGRRNLDVRTEAQATNILIEGNRAVGIAYAHGHSAMVRYVKARREVILCAGAANTPKLMMLSGIGNPEDLTPLGIQVRHALGGVGRNLRDHHMIRSVCRVKNTQTLNETARGLSLIGQVARWALRQPSILSISPSVAYAFWKSNPTLQRADLQFHFSPGSYKEGVAGLLDEFPRMTLGFYVMRPQSTGAIRLRSRDPSDDPVIQPNYMTHENDQRATIDGLRLTRKILHGAALQRYRAGDEFPPETARSDAELLDFARQRGGTAWHLMGTCRMGPVDRADSVVDPNLRVIGMEGLRVADASIMPTMPSGNTQIPTMMIAEKAADLILGRGSQHSE